MAAVSLRSLSRTFSGVPAVRDLTFDVEPGTLFGIVGPDGAGKTTTLRMIAGVLPPTGGDVEVLGVSVARNPEGVKPHIAYMSQRFGLYQDLTVRENIFFYADLYRVPRAELPARMNRLHSFSGLGEFEDRLAGQLSGGMKQKLSLSCALVHQPDVMLLDEPTFGVDPISRRDLWLIVHEMVATGITVIVTTSYMDEAERCDGVALLHQGRLIAHAAPDRIQQRLSGRLLEVRAGNPRELREIVRARTDVRSATLFGDAVHVIAATPEAAVLLLNELPAPDVSVSQIEASLEDAFIDLTGDA